MKFRATGRYWSKGQFRNTALLTKRGRRHRQPLAIASSVWVSLSEPLPRLRELVFPHSL